SRPRRKHAGAAATATTCSRLARAIATTVSQQPFDVYSMTVSLPDDSTTIAFRTPFPSMAACSAQSSLVVAGARRAIVNPNSGRQNRPDRAKHSSASVHGNRSLAELRAGQLAVNATVIWIEGLTSAATGTTT